MAKHDFSGYLAWEHRPNTSGRLSDKSVVGSSVSASVSQFNTVAGMRNEYRVSAEARTMGEHATDGEGTSIGGMPFVGVMVKFGEHTVLEWNNLDRSRWKFPSIDGDALPVDPSPHVVTVVEALCSALDKALTHGAALGVKDDSGEDALAAGRLLLSSAAFSRAAGVKS